jgi:hypothetical protein
MEQLASLPHLFCFSFGGQLTDGGGLECLGIDDEEIWDKKQQNSTITAGSVPFLALTPPALACLPFPSPMPKTCQAQLL